MCKKIETTINHAIARNAQMHAESLAQNFQEKLLEARNQLSILAAGEISKTEMLKRLRVRNSSDHITYREIAFNSSEADERYVFIYDDGAFIDLPAKNYNNGYNSPFQAIESETEQGAVKISEPLEVSYNLVQSGDKWRDISFQVVRLSTTLFNDDGTPKGILMISVDLKDFRNILSYASVTNTHLSEDDTLTITNRSFFFDYYGWIIFQSEDPHKKNTEILDLRSDDVRAGLKGDIGRRGYSAAFRPQAQNAIYQEMLENIKNGRSGYLSLPNGDEGLSIGQAHAESISFAPVSFQRGHDGSMEIIGGIALLDTSFLSMQAYSGIISIFASLLLLALILISASLWWIGNRTSRNIKKMTEQLSERNSRSSSEPLSLPLLPQEFSVLCEQINTVLSELRRAKAESATQIAAINARKLNEPAENLPNPEELSKDILVGHSPAMLALKQQITTIANVEGDVLIVGETGTGKELVSQAIHAASDRASKPFISINCGALDENLLMDTLFGHVKGAFTEAKNSRRGAFIAAEGGTLLLDEIGNATPKVQQALLRALSIRKIRPLGSDQDLDFSARIIAATNANLRNDSKDNSFRNDLYFRLSVFSIQTPPLRERKMDIPALVVHFISSIADPEGKDASLPLISRGALEKLMQYDWPGNVRELKNVITRALAFCQKDIIQANDILLDAEGEKRPLSEAVRPTPLSTPEDTPKTMEKLLEQLNERQQTILPAILKRGEITRQEYQDLSADPISMRTAQYDLQQLVNLGLVRKEGRGPFIRYIVENLSPSAQTARI